MLSRSVACVVTGLVAAPDKNRGWADPWEFAGDGWRAVTKRAIKREVHGTGEHGKYGLNSPGPEQVNQLHEKILGVKLLPRFTTFENVESELARFLRARGGVAHKGVTPKDLNLAGVYSWRYFIEQLAHELDTYLEQ